MPFRLLFFLALLATVLPGCGGGGGLALPPTTIGPSQPIPIKVWRIQAFGDSISSPEFNIGCRSYDAEINGVVLDFLSKTRFLGPRAVFQWDREIGTFSSIWIQNRPHSTLEITAAIQDELFDHGTGYDYDAINFYFVGDVQFDPYPLVVQLLAATYDPRLAAFVGAIPFVFCNDNTFNAPDAFSSPTSLGAFADSNVLPHEMTHYLARVDPVPASPPAATRCYPIGAPSPVPNRCYDTGEHVPAGAYNVLRRFAPFVLFLPGSPSDSATEKGEIDQRIFNGRWNLP